ncbi:MAG: GMC family oxidoreductase N-terminal domain-containing protein [Myxococcota bacterium]
MTRLALPFWLLWVSACRPDGRPTDYEYVVVGAGAGGGPLAARLARAGHRVLLLEAGADVGDRLQYQVPAMHALSTEDPAMAWWYFVQHSADPAVDATDSKITPEGVLYPRGSGLGGSTAVNAMVTVLPSASDWDGLAAATGDSGFRASRMAPYFDRVREWLSIEQPDASLAMDDPQVADFLLAAADEVGTDGSDVAQAAELAQLVGGDLNQAFAAGEPEGLFRLPMATRDGHRRGTRERILQTVAEGWPLTVQTDSLVTRVLWGDGPTAIGVEVLRGHKLYGAALGDDRDAPGTPEQVFASREVILAAGTFNTPQLLMLSGVGDPDALATLGIEPVVELPAVGHNLQDRYEAAVVSELDEPLALVDGCALGSGALDDPCLLDWQRGEGVYRTNGFAGGVLARSRPELAVPDLVVFAFPADARGYYPGYAADAVARHDRFSWLILEAHTTNDDGAVSLASADPLERPRIAFHSYDEAAPLDDPELHAVVDGIRLIRRITERARARDPSGRIVEIWPGQALEAEEDLAAFVRRESWGHHACCTSPMGRDGDPDAVLDAQFRVQGAQGLRVVDASAFPRIPGTFVALPIFMLSERAADVILRGLGEAP